MDKHEIDFSTAIKARYTKMCDECSKELDGGCCNETSLQVPEGKYSSSSKHFCDTECLKAYVGKMKSPE